MKFVNKNNVAHDLHVRAPMKLRGLVASALVLAGLVAACSDDGPTVVYVPSSSSTSSGGTSGKSGYGSSGSSGYDYGGFDGTSGYVGSTSGYAGTSGTVTPPPVDLASILSLKASYDVCGKAPGTCSNAESFTVDFQKSSLTDTTCLELSGGDAGSGQTTNADTTKPLTSAELDTVKTRIAALSKSSGGGGYDGPIKVLEITTKSGKVLYSPEAGCGDTSQFTWIDAQSWNDLWDTLRAL